MLVRMVRMFGFMGVVLVSVIMHMVVIVQMFVFMGMRVGMFVHAVAMIVRMRMFMRVGVVIVIVRAGVVVGNLGSNSGIFFRKNVYFRCGNAAAAYFAHLKARADV